MSDDGECEERSAESEGEGESDADEEEESKPAKKPAKPAKNATKEAKPSKGKQSKEVPAAPAKKIGDVDKWVLDFLNTRNRPYSAINVVDSSGGAIKKAAAEKALQTLHEAGRITCKDLKKQKVYMARQENFEVPDASKVAQMELCIKQLTEEVAALEKDVKASTGVLQHLQAQLTDEQLAQEIDKKTKAIAEMEGRLNALHGGTKLIDEAQKAKIQAAYEAFRAAWRKRKRMACDMIDAMCGDTKRPKDCMHELGIETDEQMKVTLESTELHYKKQKTK